MPRRLSSPGRAVVHGDVVHAAAAPPPIFLTPLIGRDRDLGEVAALLRGRRLVTLVGAGGSGKTRLAAAVASSLAEQVGENLAWVELAPLADSALVGMHVAGAIGAREESGRPPSDVIAEAIGRRPALLVLDNCEHLIGSCAALAGELLRGCPELRILATSRQALGVEGEKVWAVPPLALPAPGEEAAAAECSAIQLFVQRASDAAPAFALTDVNLAAVVRICRRLDGLPLAIELAAARVKVLAPEQLANRLDDLFAVLVSGGQAPPLPRHRTLRALMDWSYGLLSGDERRLLERLSVFAGGFSLESAESVAAFGCLGRGDVLDLLAGLVDKSLVAMQERAGEARYVLLETVRQYAGERLRERRRAPDEEAPDEEAPDEGAPVLARRHALHYLALAERAAALLHRAAQLDWLARLDGEHDNLRAALAWSLAAGEPETAMRLCVALRDFWRMRGHLTEGLRWMEQALAASAGACAPGDVLRARVLAATGLLARRLGDHDLFRARAVEAEALARASGDAAALADALTQRGVQLRDMGEPAAARALLDDAVSLWRGTADGWGLTAALCARATIAHAEGDLALGRALRLEAVDVSRRAGDREGEGLALIGLGELARQEGDVPAARAHYARSMLLFQELGDSWHVAALLHNAGWLAAEAGEHDEARRSFAAALAMFDGERALILAPCLAGLARLLVDTGADAGLAAVAFGSAMAFLERQRMRPANADAPSIERTRSKIAAALGEDAFARAIALGAATPPAAHVRRALELLQRPGPAAALRVATLGPVEIVVDGAALDAERFGSRRARELLLLLLCRPDGCTREQVGVAFWPDASSAEVKNRFHVTLHRLRKALGHPEWIAAVEDRYRMAPEAGADFDAARFESEVTASLRALARGDAEDAARRLGAALSLYRGDFLEHESAGDWHLETRERLRLLHMEGQLAQGDLLMRAERFADAAAVYRSLLARDELHEAASRRLMECYARSGQRAEALRHYERFALRLRDELDAAPESETTSLYERLQQGAVR